MPDIDKIPFAEWLEGFVEHIVSVNPQWIGVVVVGEDGKPTTGYTEDDNTFISLAKTAMQADMIMNLIRLNRDAIREILFEEDGEADGEGAD